MATRGSQRGAGKQSLLYSRVLERQSLHTGRRAKGVGSTKHVGSQERAPGPWFCAFIEDQDGVHKRRHKGDIFGAFECYLVMVSGGERRELVMGPPFYTGILVHLCEVLTACMWEGC